ncbi:MAG TPA: hypothetical protein VJO53_09190 [Candidatus Acidoferrales bacterium]|nr:hypothetical protein [Candidatus Acidoferrales bacterium]
MERPTGVTILGVLLFIGAGLLALAALMMLLGGAMMSSMSARPHFGMMAGIGAAILGVVCLGIAALYVVLGVGLWMLQNWARVLTIVFAILGAIVSVMGLFGHMQLHPVLFFWRVIVVVIDVWIVVYLLKPHVRLAFGAGGS